MDWVKANCAEAFNSDVYPFTQQHSVWFKSKISKMPVSNTIHALHNLTIIFRHVDRNVQTIMFKNLLTAPLFPVVYIQQAFSCTCTVTAFSLSHSDSQ